MPLCPLWILQVRFAERSALSDSATLEFFMPPPPAAQSRFRKTKTMLERLRSATPIRTFAGRNAFLRPAAAAGETPARGGLAFVASADGEGPWRGGRGGGPGLWAKSQKQWQHRAQLWRASCDARLCV